MMKLLCACALVLTLDDTLISAILLNKSLLNRMQSLTLGGSCPAPLIKNGRVRSRQRGRIVKFYCLPGYQLVGERTATCRNRTWSIPIPKCVTPKCSQQNISIPNGLAISSNNAAVFNFYCQQGYDLNGPGVIYCDGYTWDQHVPSCLPTNTTPPLFCDFESEDLCHWTHDLNHDMNWVRDSYKTPTGYSMATGPSYDHTKGKGSNGHYMYIESSSKKVNDTARLISPIHAQIPTNVCLEFWYHMYGRTTGTLRAYLKKISDPWPLNITKAVFTKSGNQGDVWYRAYLNLGPITEQFQIIMEGVRGNGYVSDIAIDDINIIPNCTYEEDPQETTTTESASTEVLKDWDTCENRCGPTSPSNSMTVLKCDCDDFCGLESRCCPDYLDYCLSTTEPPSTSTKLTTVQLTTTLVTTTQRFVRPTGTSAPSPTIVIVDNSTQSYHDDIEVPPIQPSTEDYDIDSNDINFNTKEREHPFQVQDADTDVGEIKFTKAGEEKSKLALTFMIIGIVGGTILVGALVGMLLVKCKWARFRSPRLGSGQGDSQSDVRFLTADEVLDFSLDKDYDDL